MARKNKKLLSTLRALEDKQEPTSNQRELEEKSVPAPLNLAVTESEREPQKPEVANHVIAPLLTSSLLEEQLSEVTAIPVATAESLHISDVTTPTETEALTETGAPAETEALETEALETETPAEAEQESLEPSQDGAIAELEPELGPEAEPQPETASIQSASVAPEEFSVSEHDSPETTIPSEPVTVPQTTPAVADPIATQAIHRPQTAAEQPENPEQPTEASTPAIATTSQTLSQAELLKRPEAFALIVFATLSSLWQAYVRWIKPTAHRQRSSQHSPHRSTVEPK